MPHRDDVIVQLIVSGSLLCGLCSRNVFSETSVLSLAYVVCPAALRTAIVFLFFVILFVFRLACCADKFASQILVACESVLFRYRLKTLDKSQLLRFLHRFNRLRHHFLTALTSASASGDIYEFLSTVGGHSVDWSQIVECYNVGCHGCARCKMMIPFRFVPCLVAQRLVTLHSGKAAVTSRHLLELLVAVFEAWLEYGLRMAVRCRRAAVDGDSRLKLIFSQCVVGFTYIF